MPGTNKRRWRVYKIVVAQVIGNKPRHLYIHASAEVDWGIKWGVEGKECEKRLGFNSQASVNQLVD